MTYTTSYSSSLGELFLASDGHCLTELDFAVGTHTKSHGATAKKRAEAHYDAVGLRDLDIFAHTANWLDQYFRGERPQDAPPLAPKGSDFQLAVWRLLRKIPYGETITYGQLAKDYCAETGRATMSAQAVGGAVGRNPISIIVPCHRVVGSDGSLTGYASGVEHKVGLLRLEGLDVDEQELRLSRPSAS